MSKPSASKPTSTPGANPLWGGHFDDGPDAAFAAINPSIAVDQRLYAHDIAGSLAHCRMLEKTGIVSASDSAAIQAGLAQVQSEIEAGKFTFSEALEDIHMHIEARLKEIIGEPAGRLHTARSRNDQVATDLRLYARDAVQHIDVALQQFLHALHQKALQHTDTIMPGFTHLQPAQPITLAHHLHAYIEMFLRDRSRLRDTLARLNESPLGAAALAGTTYPIDRAITADALGFARPMRNSLDAVASRDYVVELLAAYAICATHLSRLAEELIFWATPLVGFVTFSDRFTSGSSIMPQKRNPDAAELVRGKTGSITGALVTLLTTLKALPLAYNKDLQEDKRPFFHACDELLLSIRAMAGMVGDMQPNPRAMRDACARGYLNATDLADWLVQHLQLPFRDAHHVTGKLVKLAEQQQITLDALPLEAMQSIEPRITREIFAAIELEQCVARRTSAGGTAPDRVREALDVAKKEIG